MSALGVRDDVLIVLNEREPLKQQMAAALAEQLAARNFTHERLRPSSDLAQIIEARSPRVLVLDYLLGDEGTALDLLQSLRDNPSTLAPFSIVWTDEPSASVAVQAMKLGAHDYIELQPNRPIDKVVRSLEECLALANERERAPRELRNLPERELLVAEAPHSRLVSAEARQLVFRRSPVIVLYGAQGTGRSALGRFIHSQRRRAGQFVECAVDEWTGTAFDLCGGSPSTPTPLLSCGATVMLDHAEFDFGELAESVQRSRTRIWPSAPQEEDPVLIVGTTSEETARAWNALLDAPILRLPTLAERHDDFLPLLQRFTQEARNIGVMNKVETTSQLIDSLARLDWPGNIRELRAVLIDVLTTPSPLLEEIAQSLVEVGELTGDPPGGMLYVLASKLRWEQTAVPSRLAPSPIRTRRAFEAANGNMRIAAAMLGAGIPQVRRALGLSSALETSDGAAGEEI